VSSVLVGALQFEVVVWVWEWFFLTCKGMTIAVVKLAQYQTSVDGKC